MAVRRLRQDSYRRHVAHPLGRLACDRRLLGAALAGFSCTSRTKLQQLGPGRQFLPSPVRARRAGSGQAIYRDTATHARRRLTTPVCLFASIAQTLAVDRDSCLSRAARIFDKASIWS
jgi:hypothetical protein